MKRTLLLHFVPGIMLLPVTLPAQEKAMPPLAAVMADSPPNATGTGQRNFNRVDYIAKTEASLLGKKHHCDAAQEAVLHRLVYDRETQVDSVLNAYNGTPALEAKLAAVISRNDSLIDRFKCMADASYYAKNKIAIMQHVKPLTRQQQDNISNNLMLLSLTNNNGLEKNFSDCIQHELTDTAYYAVLYKKEIQQKAHGAAQPVIRSIHLKNNLSTNGIREVGDLIYQREKALATIDYAHPVYNRTKDSLMKMVAVQYEPLINRAMMQDGIWPVKSKFSAAIRHREALKLEKKQVDSLLAAATKLEELRAAFSPAVPGEKFNARIFENEQTPKILTDIQYFTLLTLENHDQAMKWARSDWEELKKRGLTEGLDSAKVIAQIANYDLNFLIVKDRYSTDKEKQKLAMKQMPGEPAILVNLKTARKYNNPVNATASGSFKW